MCGIIGILGKDDVAQPIVEGLRRLEYRGYDSAGVATLQEDGIDRRRAAGKLSVLEGVLAGSPLPGVTGIGHTRWATHGAPVDENAHPHATARVAIVHNGIIENFRELRDELTAKGYEFSSATDSEVIAQLITAYLDGGANAPIDAFRKALAQMRGAFAIAAIIAGEDDLMLAARRGSPLAIGRGDGEMFVGSDAFALAPFTNRVTYLNDGDHAVVTRDGFEIFDETGAAAKRTETISSVGDALVDKDGHRHFMAKEIYEQPEVIGHTLARFVDPTKGTLHDRALAFNFSDLSRLVISACGTAYYAGLIAKYWFERWAKLPVEIDIASELRYRDIPYTENGGALFISQSGETADTLAALREAKGNDQRIAAIVNVPESSIAREADVVFQTAAGPEIGVASTKAFTCQLATLACLAIAAGKQRGHIDSKQEATLIALLMETPRLVSQSLKQQDKIEEIAHDLAKARDILYIGRGLSFPMALEGALKLKEISYIHAEGYAAGELKHGPIALIDEHVPVVVVAPSDQHFEKTISNMHEIIARGGRPLLISDAEGIAKAGEVWAAIEAPACDPMTAPIVYAGPIQMLAYFTATTKGTDVDQPRNLAKSVTVE
ncbi:MAG: glutamine--fructose-6-phosphate transaminase (isomerizing) [Pseudomonadota bacterium]